MINTVSQVLWDVDGLLKDNLCSDMNGVEIGNILSVDLWSA